jgi:hypothetical protein
MTRYHTSLDGTWSFWKENTPTQSRRLMPEKPVLPDLPARPIQVPASWQAQFDDLRLDFGAAWYCRTVEIPASWFQGRSILLGFGAVDYRATVWVNGTRVGSHEGGYLPFELDITSAAHPGENVITVYVEDFLDEFAELPHGKQSWYGPVSGLWQSVWVESRPAQHILGMHIFPRKQQVEVEVRLSRALAKNERLDFKVTCPAGEVCAAGTSPYANFMFIVSDPDFWSPEQPNLYTLTVTMVGGTESDEAMESFGFRTIEAKDGQLFLNGQPLMLRAALDQDYYPGTVYTPPSLEFIEDQLRKAKHLGLNCMRVHIKVADPRYYAAADRLGMLIWTEIPNWKDLTQVARQNARQTLNGILERDWNHPSIIIWTIINENWGTNIGFDAAHRAWLSETYDYIKSVDPFRLVVDNSACHGNFHVVTDIEDMHNYYAIPDHYQNWRDWVAGLASRPPWTFAPGFQTPQEWQRYFQNPWDLTAWKYAPEVRRKGDEPIVLSEFGNWGLPDVDKLRAGFGGNDPWWFETGYEFGDGVVYPHGIQKRFHDFRLDRVFGSLAELSQASQEMEHQALKYEIEQIRKHSSLCGYVITEFTDVNWECNGLLDLCRNPKSFYDTLAEINTDDVIIPEWTRLAYWPGETVEIGVSASIYSKAPLPSASLEWHMDGQKDIQGAFPPLNLPNFSVTQVGTVRFTVPEVMEAQAAELIFELFDGQQVKARNRLQIFILPRLEAPAGVKIFAPRLTGSLEQAGYTVTDDLASAQIAITQEMTPEFYAWTQTGGKLLWLAESEHPNPGLPVGFSVDPRRGTPLQGDWASTMSWIAPGPVFQHLPAGGVVGFAYADLTPDNVIKEISAADYARRVHAGIYAGWIQKNAALVVEGRLGMGHYLVSTFRLSEHLADHPVAAAMVWDMLHFLAGKK